MNTKPLYSLLFLLTASCGPSPNMSLKVPETPQTRIGVFKDRIAYNDVRGIYILKDSQTGKEFIGVSGIGITELGSHIVGKSTTTDER